MPPQTNPNQPISYTPVQPMQLQKSNNKTLYVVLAIVGIIAVLCACCVGMLIFINATGSNSTSYSSSCVNGTCTVEVCNKDRRCVTDKCYTKNCEDNLRIKLEEKLK